MKRWVSTNDSKVLMTNICIEEVAQELNSIYHSYWIYCHLYLHWMNLEIIDSKLPELDQFVYVVCTVYYDFLAENFLSDVNPSMNARWKKMVKFSFCCCWETTFGERCWVMCTARWSFNDKNMSSKLSSSWREQESNKKKELARTIVCLTEYMTSVRRREYLYVHFFFSFLSRDISHN